MKPIWIRLAGGLALVAGLGWVLVVASLGAGGSGLGRERRLPDGSRIVLRDVAVTATNYFFTYERGGALTRRIARFLPAALRSSFGLGPQARIGMKGIHQTNLMLVTSNHGDGPGWVQPSLRAQVFDDLGNESDCLGSLGAFIPGTALNCWNFGVFPRRRPRLGLRLLASVPGGGWTNGAEFEFLNPFYREFRQWIPEPRPAIRLDGPLAVTLEEFSTALKAMPPVAAGPASAPASKNAPRKTRARFSFRWNGAGSSNWRIQTLVISDATGNEWSPGWGPGPSVGFNWTSNGVVEFLGRLWPGENAWELHVEAVPTSGFTASDLWEVAVPLPGSGSVTALTNSWKHEGGRVQLAAIGGPEADLGGEFRGLAWRGSEQSGVYSLAWKKDPTGGGGSLALIGGRDQNGKDLRVLRPPGQEGSDRVVFFKPAEGATMVRLRLGFIRSRFVEFLARPEFAD